MINCLRIIFYIYLEASWLTFIVELIITEPFYKKCLLKLISAQDFGIFESSEFNVVENDAEPPELTANPSLARMKKQEEDVARKHTFSLIKCYFHLKHECETPKEAWNKLKGEFEGHERVKAIKLLTLKPEFELLRMANGENVEKFASKLLELLNKIRLFSEASLVIKRL